MKKHSVNPHKHEPRSIAITILAALLAIIPGKLAIDFFPTSTSDLASNTLFGVSLCVFIILAAIAIYGRKEPQKDFINNIFSFLS